MVWTENNSVISAWAQLSLRMFLALWVFLSFKPLIFYLKVFMRITVKEESRKIWLTSLFWIPFHHFFHQSGTKEPPTPSWFVICVDFDCSIGNRLRYQISVESNLIRLFFYFNVCNEHWIIFIGILTFK